MKAADEMVDVIREIIKQENAKRDATILCQVVDKVGDDVYNLAIVPDKNVAIKGVPNMTKFNLEIGDYCYVYKIQNNIANAFICYKI